MAPMPSPGADQPTDPARQLPNGIWLSAEQFQELLDDQARLRGKEPPPEEVSPTKLLLSKGRVEGNLVYFKVQIDFETQRRTSVLPLAFTQGQLTDVLLDGRTPGLRRGPDGLAVLVNRSGEHQLVFDVVVRLVESTQRGGCLVLKLDLPRSPDTQIELTLPEGFKDLRANDRPVGERPPGEADGPIFELHGRRLTGLLLLGATDKLQLSWRGARAATGPLQTAAEGRVLVSVDDRHMVRTEATLSLKVLSNQTDQWRLLVPAGAQVKMATVADEGRLREANVQVLPFFSIWTLTLKERSAEPLGVVVTQEGTVLRPGNAPTPVGPFLVVGAARQSGTLLVSNAASDLGLRCLPTAATTSRTLTDAERSQPGAQAQGFQYHGVPLPTLPDDPRALALLALQAEAKHGQLKVRPVYQLRLSREPGERRWQLLTTLDVSLVEPGVQRLEIILPADCRFVPLTPEEERPPVLRVEPPPASPALGPMLVAGGAAGLARTTLVLHLSRDRWEEFKFSFRVQYEPPATAGKADFGLPRYRDATEALSSLTATVGVPDDLELTVPGGANGWELVRQTPQELTWKPDAAAASPPDRLTVAWRAYRPEVRAFSDVNLDLLPRVGKVSQELKLQFPPHGVPLLLPLRLPPGLSGLRVVKGGTLQTLSRPSPQGDVLCTIKPDEGASKGTEWELTLTYEFPLPERPAAGQPAALVKVPLALTELATVSETHVRVWGGAGPFPELPPGSGWSELPLAPEPSDPRRPPQHPGRLPVLVLRCERPDSLLTLRVGEPGPGPTAAVLTDRALIRVTLEGAGQQVRAQVRARFRLLKLFAQHLDLELPASVVGSDLRVTLDGRTVDPETVDEEGHHSDAGRFARLRLNPDLVRWGSVLELKYQFTPTLASQGTYQTLLQAPVLLRCEPGQLIVCWQVVLPAGSVAIGPEGGPATGRAWGWRGWLLAPMPAARTDDLERWIAGPDASAAPGTEVGTLVCWREGFDPLTVTHAPQQAWLLACSLSLLVAALGIFLLLRRALRGRQPGVSDLGGRIAWLVLVLLTVAGVGTALVWPTTTAALAVGAEPGAAVLVQVERLVALWPEQRRRRIAYLPSFRRGPQNSSLLRPSSSPPVRPPGEPSTVDVPRPASSQFPAPSEAAR